MNYHNIKVTVDICSMLPLTSQQQHFRIPKKVTPSAAIVPNTMPVISPTFSPPIIITGKHALTQYLCNVHL